MLLKLGVDISRLEMHCRKSLSTVDAVYNKAGLGEAILTSTFEGSHSPGSLHYQNRAYDIRLPSKYPCYENLNISDFEIFSEIKEKLGKDFDVVMEGTHIHIEYDPK